MKNTLHSSPTICGNKIIPILQLGGAGGGDYFSILYTF